jgi:hypothetical protein
VTVLTLNVTLKNSVAGAGKKVAIPGGKVLKIWQQSIPFGKEL